MSALHALPFLALLAVVAPPAAGGVDGAGEPLTLAHVPRVGERRTTAFVLDRALVAQRLVTRMGGDEQTSQDQIEVSGRTSLRFAEEVREVEGARATVFRRTLEEAQARVDLRQATPGGKPRAHTIEASSPLTGASVLFRWIPARGEYGRLYDGLETSEEFLPRLAPSVDLAGLLPAGPVRAGDTWKPDATRVAELFAPGGRLPMRFAKGADPLLARTASLGVAGPLHEVFGGAVSGTIEARLAAVEGDTARIALVLDVRAEADQTALNRERLTAPERYDGVRVSSARAVWSFRGEGELRWDVRAGRAEQLALAGAEEIRLELAMDGPQGAGGSDLTLSGALKLSFDVRAGPNPR
ncbi:MAG: hypothetical protein JNK02_12500 [Planctomycetes bacterium]|nr:hypothetical protein [Planctomycetota bacterium]